MSCHILLTVFYRRWTETQSVGVRKSCCMLKLLFEFNLNTETHHSSPCVCVCMCVLVAQSCLTVCDPMDCSPAGSSVHGIFQARILEWVAISSSRGSSWPRDWTQFSCISCIGRQSLKNCTTWEVHSSPRWQQSAVSTFSWRCSVLISKAISPQSCDLAMLERHI